ncbi:hypothetical protein [Kutzneria kofuensis]|uniref:Uncharacterized protein n=1 Tax=Kutzneria kofuensis TaxID=103725 RepID=A0A7W9KL19_9PSEU|nr:hypothetical protein [Kutzneria kofuensis]MBB5894526.1 hypothetical protein [Kutzneria kofuensis]
MAGASDRSAIRVDRCNPSRRSLRPSTMKGLTTVVGAGALVLAISACGQTQTTTTPSGSANGIAPAGQGGSLRDVPAEQVDVSKLPAGYPARVQLDDNGAVLAVQGQEGGCEHSSAELSAQDAASVHVLLTRNLVESDRVCSKELRLTQLTVQLDKPLADRKVVLEQRTVRS